MGKSIFQKLIDGKSEYIPVSWNDRDVIMISNHLPNPNRLLNERMTGKCKNIYLIFVKSTIDETSNSSVKLAKLIKLIESNNPEIRVRGMTALNNLIVDIGTDAKKGMNYCIIDANSDDEIDTVIDDAKRMLKTTVFTPLKYITLDD